MKTSLFVLALVGSTAVNAQAIPPDALYADQFESGLVGFGPNLSALPQGVLASPSFPAALTLTLSEPAASNLFVPVVSANPMALMVVGGGVTVLAGTSSAVVRFDALQAGPVPVEVSARLGNARSAGVRVEAALNETNSPLEADYCAQNFPLSATAVTGRINGPWFGRLFELGVTEPPGAPAGVIAEVGVGPTGADPRQLANWQFYPASYNLQVGNDDEFIGDLRAPGVSGTYRVAYRFSADQGGTWTYCDADGAGSNPGLGFEPAALSTLNVVALPANTLVINEVEYDQPGTDTAEYIEIYNGLPTAVDLGSHAVVLVNGAVSPAAEYARINLSGTLAPGGIAVICPANSAAGNCGPHALPPGVTRFLFAGSTDQIQNGAPDGIALVNIGTAQLVDALSYEGSITVATIAGVGSVSLVEGTATGAADPNTGSVSMQRSPNGADSNDAATDWVVGPLTPGAPNP